MTTDASYYRLAMKIFTDFSGSIAVPAVFGALFGKWLDDKYHTAPKYLMVFLLIALVFTVVIIVKKARFYQKEYELLNKK